MIIYNEILKKKFIIFHSNFVNIILKQFFFNEVTKLFFQKSALHIAVEKENFEIVKLLADRFYLSKYEYYITIL